MIQKLARFAFVISLLFCLMRSGFAQHAVQALEGDSPEVKHFVAPDYPVAAWLSRTQGSAVTELVIKQDGTVDSARLISGFPIFRKAIEAALEKWTFRAAKPMRVNIVTRFTLTGDCPWTPPRVSDQQSRIGTQVIADLPSNVEITACVPIIETNVNQSRHH